MTSEEEIKEFLRRAVQSAGGRLMFFSLQDMILNQEEEIVNPFLSFQRKTHMNISHPVSSSQKCHKCAVQNFLRCYKALQVLWEAATNTELAKDANYTDVVILRDDALWFADFTLLAIVSTRDHKRRMVHTLNC